MKMTVGIDEAVRGPLAGPVAVGAVACAEGFDILAAFPGLNDSKKLTEKKRDALFLRLQEEHRAGNVRWVVTLASAKMIDEQGMTFAIRHALTRAVRKLLPSPEEGQVFLDGSLHAPAEYVQETVVGGDGTVPAIMLASVAAKVSRDRLMLKLHEEYPAYGFATHKGYGTKAHFEAVRLYGPCPAHRQLFLRNFLQKIGA